MLGKTPESSCPIPKIVSPTAGLVWGLVTSPPSQAFAVKTFFLCCVTTAGFYGAATVSRRILFVQAAPAILALGLLCASR